MEALRYDEKDAEKHPNFPFDFSCQTAPRRRLTVLQERLYFHDMIPIDF